MEQSAISLGHSSTSLPIDKLPTEILQQIFSICSERGIQPADTLNAPIPVVLSWVCSGWRTIAISHQELWSSLIFYISSRMDGMRVYRLTELFLKRAGQSPLRLEFNQIDREEVQPSFLDETLDLLCLRSNQWKTVTFSAQTQFLQRLPFQKLASNLQSLHSLQFIDGNLEVADAVPCNLEFLGTCPALRSATLTLWCPRPNDVSPLLDWPQLDRLTMWSTISPAFSASIISQCPNITRLNLIASEFTFPNRPTESCVLPKLRFLSIKIGMNPSAIFETFLPHLIAPELDSLSIQSKYSRANMISDEAEKALSEFVQHQSGRITSLALLDPPLSVRQAISLFHSLPRLQNLHLAEHPHASLTGENRLCTPELLRSFGVDHGASPNGSTILPRLGHVKLEVHGRTFVTLEFFESVKSRLNINVNDAFSALRIHTIELEVLDKRHCTPEILSELLSLKDLDESLRVFLLGID